MLNIQSNSQESQLKTKIRDICSSETANRTITYIDDLVRNFNLDYEKIAVELLSAINRTETIQSPYAFITSIAYKCALERRGEFERKKIKICFLDLHTEMEEIGMTGELWEKLLIDLMEEHCVNEFNISLEEMINTNRAMIIYCKNKGIKTFREYAELMTKSKVFKKCNIPVPFLIDKAKKLESELKECLL